MRALLALSALAACGPPPPLSPGSAPTWQPLIDRAAWAPVPPEADPLASHRPPDLRCDPEAWGDEGLATEIRTESCDYLALSQPLAEGIRPGDLLRVTFGWGQLRAPAPAEGHIALLVQDTVIAERTLEIPGPAEAHTFTTLATHAFPEATPVILHVHNHGANTWQLYDFARRP